MRPVTCRKRRGGGFVVQCGVAVAASLFDAAARRQLRCPISESAPFCYGPNCLVTPCVVTQSSGTLVPYDITYYITLSFTVYDIIYDKSSL